MSEIVEEEEEELLEDTPPKSKKRKRNQSVTSNNKKPCTTPVSNRGNFSLSSTTKAKLSLFKSVRINKP